MKMVRVTAIAPAGGYTVEFTASGPKGLEVERYAANSLHIDVRDMDKPEQEGGYARLIGSIPTSWTIQYSYEKEDDAQGTLPL